MDMPSASLAPWGWHALTTTWQWSPGWTTAVVVLAAAYAAGLARARRRGGRPVGPWRVAAFLGGLLVLETTVCSAVGVYAMAVFWVHMIEHLLLIMVVPALLVLGHPLTVLRAAAGPRRVDPVLRSWPVSVLVHPLVGFGLYAGVIVGTHLTGFMDQMAMSPTLMHLEQVLYLVSGLVFLLPLVGDEPVRWRLPYLGRLLLVLLGMVPDTVVGIVLMQTSRNPFPMMTSMRPDWAPPALKDVEIAGALMWVAGDGLMMLLALGVVAAMLSRGGRSNVLGTRLEAIRRGALAEQISRGNAEDGRGLAASEADLDEDDAALDAYNRMLSRLHGDR